MRARTLIAVAIVCLASCRAPAAEAPAAPRCVEHQVASPCAPTRPLLTIYAAPWCGPCRQLSDDLDKDRQFRAALHRLTCWRWISADPQNRHVLEGGLTDVPTFRTADGRTWTGYAGKQDLLDRVAGRVPQPTSAAPHSAPNPRPAVGPESLDALRLLLDNTRERIDRDLDGLRTRDNEIAGGLNGLRNAQDGHVSRLESAVHDLGKRLESRVAEVAPSAAGAAAKGLVPRVLGLLAPYLPQSIAAIAVPAGIATGPVGAVAALALGFVLQRVRKRLTVVEQRPTTTVPAAAPQPSAPQVVAVPVDSPPARSTVVEQHYVPVESDRVSQAYAWANSQLVRKYPGSETTLEVQASLVKQWLGANPPKQGS